MIQLDEKDKREMMADPPAYSTESTLYPPPATLQLPSEHGTHAQSSYAQSSYASSAYAPSPSVHSPQAYPPSPASGAPLVQQSQPQPQPQPSPQPQLTPAQMEAQVGSQYQQQLFARCARGDHDVTTKYGPCGIISAIILFPFGLICLFMDVEKKCARCGVIVS